LPPVILAEPQCGHPPAPKTEHRQTAIRKSFHTSLRDGTLITANLGRHDLTPIESIGCISHEQRTFVAKQDGLRRSVISGLHPRGWIAR